MGCRSVSTRVAVTALVALTTNLLVPTTFLAGSCQAQEFFIQPHEQSETGIELTVPAPNTGIVEPFPSLTGQDSFTIAPTVSSGATICEPEVCSAPEEKRGFPEVRLTGFLQADFAYFSQGPDSIAAVGDIQDGAAFRRARLAGVGKVADNTSYIVEMDFAFPGRPSFMDVWLELASADSRSKFRIGQYRQPFGMDGLHSVKELLFLERALPFALLPFRQIGAMWHGYTADERSTWAFAGYRFPTDQFGSNLGDHGGKGISTRLTRCFPIGENCLWHLGGAYSFVDPSNDRFQYRNQPEFYVAETGGGVPTGAMTSVPPFVDTGIIEANNANLLALEFAFSRNSLYVQTEAICSIVNQTTEGHALLPGGYVHAGYILTGESRQYNRKSGLFGDIVPHRNFGKDGWGAFEVGVRYSFLDLTDGNIQGGRINNFTAGANWHLNRFTKFQFNYIHAVLDSPIGLGGDESSTDIFALRAHLDF